MQGQCPTIIGYDISYHNPPPAPPQYITCGHAPSGVNGQIIPRAHQTIHVPWCTLCVAVSVTLVHGDRLLRDILSIARLAR